MHLKRAACRGGDNEKRFKNIIRSTMASRALSVFSPSSLSSWVEIYLKGIFYFPKIKGIATSSTYGIDCDSYSFLLIARGC